MIRVIVCVALLLSFSPTLYADNYREHIGKKGSEDNVLYPRGHTSVAGNIIDFGNQKRESEYAISQTWNDKYHYIWLEKEVGRNQNKAIFKILDVIKVSKVDTNKEEYRSGDCRLKDKRDPRIITLSSYDGKEEHGAMNKDGSISLSYQYGVKKAWLANLKSQRLEELPPALYSKISCEIM